MQRPYNTTLSHPALSWTSTPNLNLVRNWHSQHQPHPLTAYMQVGILITLCLRLLGVVAAPTPTPTATPTQDAATPSSTQLAVIDPQPGTQIHIGYMPELHARRISESDAPLVVQVPGRSDSSEGRLY